MTEAAAAIFRVPTHCTKCGARDVVRLEHIVQGGHVILNWYCCACNHEWAVAALEAIQPRARGTRRVTDRGERRKKA